MKVLYRTVLLQVHVYISYIWCIVYVSTNNFLLEKKEGQKREQKYYYNLVMFYRLSHTQHSSNRGEAARSTPKRSKVKGHSPVRGRCQGGLSYGWLEVGAPRQNKTLRTTRLRPQRRPSPFFYNTYIHKFSVCVKYPVFVLPKMDGAGNTPSK